jgi:hypothetical protein
LEPPAVVVVVVTNTDTHRPTTVTSVPRRRLSETEEDEFCGDDDAPGVAVGLATDEFSLYANMPGWDPNSFGYHGDMMVKSIMKVVWGVDRAVLALAQVIPWVAESTIWLGPSFSLAMASLWDMPLRICR